jgi:caffeoyl-CoA O-methyltransferase
VANKGVALTDVVQQYLLDHSMARSSVHDRLVQVTADSLGDTAIMQIAPEQGAFLTLLVRLIGARTAVEVGTFTGLSALCIAEGLPEDGLLTCFDISEQWTSIGIPFWEEAGVADRIELIIGPAAQTLATNDFDRPIDFAFIDADKVGYPVYYEELLSRLRPGGLLVLDNTLQGGRVVDQAEQGESVVAIRQINDTIASDERVDSALLSVRDGVTVVRKR